MEESKTENSSSSSKPQTFMEKSSATIFSGILVGTVSAGLFNPWDRALYLSVINDRTFLHQTNWTTPYQGFWQTVWQRTLSGGLYFTLQAQFRARLQSWFKDSPTKRGENFCVGLSAGLINGMILNQLATVKYYAWRRNEPSFSSAASRMLRKGGLSPFFKGIRMTAVRDVVFGCTYEVVRGYGRDTVLRFRGSRSNDGSSSNPSSSSLIFWADMTSAGLATVVSGPFNYVRNLQYASPSEQPEPTMKECFKILAKELQEESTLFGKLRRFQQTLRIGWGTARVAVGMAFSQQLFDYSLQFWASRKN